MPDTKERIQREHRKKLVAPIVITVLLGLYFIGFSIVCLYMPEMSMVIKIFMFCVPLALVVVAIYMLVERIKEIRSGEEDDLSEY